MNASDIFAGAKKQPIGVACGAVCLICAVMIYLSGDTIDESQQNYDAKAAEAAKVAANVRNSANLTEHVAEIQSQTKELESRLVQAGQLAVNLQYFYKLEAENEVKIDIHPGTISAAAKSGKADYIGVPYSLSVQGTYKQVMAFLYRLEAGRHFCRFLNVNLNKNASGGGADAMNLSLSIELLGTP